MLLIFQNCFVRFLENFSFDSSRIFRSISRGFCSIDLSSSPFSPIPPKCFQLILREDFSSICPSTSPSVRSAGRRVFSRSSTRSRNHSSAVSDKAESALRSRSQSQSIIYSYASTLATLNWLPLGISPGIPRRYKTVLRDIIALRTWRCLHASRREHAPDNDNEISD